MSTFRFLRRLSCGLVALLSLGSCTLFSPSIRHNAMDKTGWTTHTIGRFLVDLPPQAAITATDYEIWGDRIKRLDETPETLAARIDRREQELRMTPSQVKYDTFIRRVDHGNGSVTLLYWDPKSPTISMFSHETYLVAHGDWRSYEYNGNIAVVKETSALAFLDRLAANLLSLRPGEIPTEPGFVIDGAYIAGDDEESVQTFLRFSNHPGVSMDISIISRAEDETLLERMGGPILRMMQRLADLGSDPLRWDTLRRGRHDVGPIRAEEYLQAASGRGQRVYAFTWESQGRENNPMAEPNIVVRLSVLEHKRDDIPPPKAFSSDREALDLWDAIIGSLRLRPGAVRPATTP